MTNEISRRDFVVATASLAARSQLPIGAVTDLPQAAAANVPHVLGQVAPHHVNPAGGQVDDPGPIASLSHPQHSAATGLFHVVRMSGDGEQIQHWFYQ